MGRFRRIVYLERRRRQQWAPARPVGRRLERVLDVADRLGARVEVTSVSGEESPVRVAEGSDLVVTVGRADRKGRWGAGSLERELTRESGRPVWIMHPAQGSELRVVMAAVDVVEPEGEGGSPSRAALRVAAELAGAVGARLLVVHCWTVRWETLIASRSRSGSPRGARRIAAARSRSRRERLERLLEDENVAGRAELVLRKDSVVAGLRDAAWLLEADVVVLGTAGRTGLAGVIPGNLAERALGRIPASILVVPAGSGGQAAAGGAGGAGNAGGAGKAASSVERGAA